MLELSSHTIDETILPTSPTILDVGCRNFGFTNAIKSLRPQALVYAMDPDPIIQQPSTSGVVYYQLALVHDTRVISGYASYSTGEGNFLTDLKAYYDAKMLTVPCTNISTFMKNVGIKHWDVIKLDCEGSEYGILENWPGPIATQITVEFHDYNQRDKYNDAYYAGLFGKLSKWYEVRQHPLTPVNGHYGHWDTVLVMKNGL